MGQSAYGWLLYDRRVDVQFCPRSLKKVDMEYSFFGGIQMKVKKLLHTRMRVSDMEQTLAFYREVLRSGSGGAKGFPQGITARVFGCTQQRRTY